ncbi:hypothetical protein G7046_g3280 [Stylonectria norvegica]|nr:hypothetical protein G7046_g3280 [Stylonectria norvegica]
MASQFNEEKNIPITHQDFPGKDHDMPDPKPVHDKVPDVGGDQKTYQAAGKLKGKKALITGGDSGIGAATAILFAMEGADSTIVYLPEEEKDAQNTKKRVEEKGAKCHLISLDLTERANCRKVVDFALEKMGAIDILFNNAAYQMMVEDIKDLSEDQWVHTFNINIHSFFFIAKYALEHMESGSTIINNASINAYIGRPDLLDYTSTKGAIVSFTRGLSNQLISKGIRVNAVAPGPVWTPLIPATMNEEAQKNFTSPMGRPAQPSEIATCVVFLASTDSSCLPSSSVRFPENLHHLDSIVNPRHPPPCLATRALASAASASQPSEDADGLVLVPSIYSTPARLCDTASPPSPRRTATLNPCMSPPELSVNPTSQSVPDETLSNKPDGEMTISSNPSAEVVSTEDAVHDKQHEERVPVNLVASTDASDAAGDLTDLQGEATTPSRADDDATHDTATQDTPSTVAKGKQVEDTQPLGGDVGETLSSSMATLKPRSEPPSNDTAQYLTAESSTTYIDPTPATPTTSRPPSRTPSNSAQLHQSAQLSPSRSDPDDDDKRYTSEEEQEGRSRSEIQSIMEQFSEHGGGPDAEEVMSPRMEIASPMLGNPIQHPPRKSSLEPLAPSISSHIQELQGLRITTPASVGSKDRSSEDAGPPVPPKDSSFGTPTRPTVERSMSVASPGSPVQLHRPPPPEPEPEPVLPFDFHRFLEQLRNKKADPVARYLKSFLTEFAKKQWMVHEQVKIIGDFLAFIANKMAQCDVWKDVSDAEFDNAREGMEKLVMNRLYTQTFSPAIMPPKPIPGAKPKRKGGDAPLGPGRRGQHQEDVERDDIVTQKINIYGWVREDHLDIPQVGDSGKRFLKLAQQELLKIKSYRAPRDKIICVLNCCKVIFGLLKHNKSDSSADSFMPLLIYVVLQSNPEHLVSNVQYILRFRNQEKLGGEAGYYLSSLMGAIQFIENMDRTTLTITDDEFEKHVEAAVSAIAERHQATSPRTSQQPVFNEKAGLQSSGEASLRPSFEGQESSTPRRSTSSNEGYAGEDRAAISGILKTIQRPLSSIGRIFSDDGGASAPGSSTAPRTPAPPERSSPRQSREEPRDGAQRPSSRHHELSAEEAAARQASAEVAEAQRLHRAEHANIVETLAGMFPDLDKDLISDVVYQKEGRVGLAVDACLALSS